MSARRSAGPVTHTDQAILRYLKEVKSGDPDFADVIQALERTLDVKKKERDMAAFASFHVKDGKRPVFHNILSFREGPEPQRYVDSFGRLCRWVDGCIELYRYELSRVLYPIMVFTYLRLIQREEKPSEAAAARLLEDHRHRFREVAGKACVRRNQEMRFLEGIASAKQLQTPAAAKLVEATYSLTMCEFTRDLLFTFLQGSKMPLILAIVVENLRIHVEGRPPMQVVDDPDIDLPVGSGAGNGTAEDVTNDREVHLGRVQQNWEARMDEEQKRLKAEFKRKMDEYNKLKKSDPSAQPPKEPQVVPVFPGAVKPKEPSEVLKAILDGVNPAHEAEVLAAMRARALPDATHLPSCCFFTFVNTAFGLTCATSTKGATMVAGGFEDSSTRLYDLKDGAEGLSEAARTAGLSGTQPAAVMRGHTGPVYGVDFSPDGSLLVSGSADGTARIWTTELKCCAATYQQHMFPIWDVAFAPFGYFFATGGADTTCQVFTTDRKYPVRIMVGHQSDVDCVCWHPNCTLIATGSSDRTVRLWDLNSGLCVRVLSGMREAATSLAVSPDGATIAAGSEDGSVRVWDIGKAQQMACLVGHQGPVWSLAHSEGEGRLLCSGSADCTVKIWQNPAFGELRAEQGQSEEQADKRRKKEANYLLRTWQTKSTHVYHLNFTWSNLLLGAGALTLPHYAL